MKWLKEISGQHVPFGPKKNRRAGAESRGEGRKAVKLENLKELESSFCVSGCKEGGVKRHGVRR